MAKKDAQIADANRDVRVRTRTVTPELAAEWLKRNTTNRPVRRSVVNFYASQMAERKWYLTGDAIRFDTTGAMIDGQHRLLACIEAGVAFKTLVITGVQPTIFEVIDTGEKRTGADALDIVGYKNVLTLAAAARIVFTLLTGGFTISNLRIAAVGKSNRRVKMTNAEVCDIVAAHPGLVRSVDTFAPTVHKIMSPSLGTALHYMFSRKDTVLADAFFGALIEGTSLRANDPVYVLRERLLAFRADTKTRPLAGVVAALTIKAWNNVRANRTCKILKFSIGGDHPEEFPEIA